VPAGLGIGTLLENDGAAFCGSTERIESPKFASTGLSPRPVREVRPAGPMRARSEAAQTACSRVRRGGALTSRAAQRVGNFTHESTPLRR
jgi:hypothetical protein